MSPAFPGNSRAVLAATIGLAAWVAANAQTLVSALPDNGWVSWKVQAVADAPRLCCRQGYGDIETTCELDVDRGLHVWSGDRGGVDEVRVYVNMREGRPEAIRALAASCPVSADSEIRDLGEVPASASVDWLRRQLEAADPVGNNAVVAPAIAALAVHAGDGARRALIDVAEHGLDEDRRNGAVFWIGQLRAHDSADDLKRLMFGHDDPELRQHAAFSLSQSAIADRHASLERLARTDAAGDVRARAWFWLSQTDASDIENAILAHLAEEPDRHVREQMVFALSQLPDERGLSALGRLIEDPAQDRNIRRKAIFWLSQSESTEAFERLEALLAPPG